MVITVLASAEVGGSGVVALLPPPPPLEGDGRASAPPNDTTGEEPIEPAVPALSGDTNVDPIVVLALGEANRGLEVEAGAAAVVCACEGELGVEEEAALRSSEEAVDEE